MKSHLIHIHHRLLDLSQPRVMAIVNMTDDSFYTHCPCLSEEGVLAAVASCVDAGADLVDLGACSTRPHSVPISEEVERERIAQAVRWVRKQYPELLLSVDTFRASVAETALAEGADMINDVSGWQYDERMLDVVSRARVPYILTHMRARDAGMGESGIMAEVIDYFVRRLDILHRQGVADVLIDPGFGFGKTTEENYTLLAHLEELECLYAPVLVGLSRKSMIYQPLQTDPQHALEGTVAAHMLALKGGANMLRVHDVKPALDVITIYQHYMRYADND